MRLKLQTQKILSKEFPGIDFSKFWLNPYQRISLFRNPSGRWIIYPDSKWPNNPIAQIDIRCPGVEASAFTIEAFDMPYGMSPVCRMLSGNDLDSLLIGLVFARDVLHKCSENLSSSCLVVKYGG